MLFKFFYRCRVHRLNTIMWQKYTET